MRSLINSNNRIFRERQRQIAENMAKGSHFAFTTNGCAEARQYLADYEVPIHAGLTGWEIVQMANDHMTERMVDRVFTNVWSKRGYFSVGGTA